MFEYSHEEMPYAISNWEPLERDGKSYNHIEEENKLTQHLPVVESEVVPHVSESPDIIEPDAKIDQDQETFENTIDRQLTEITTLMIKNAQFNADQLRSTILRLKSSEGKNFAPVAKQVINAVNAGSKSMDSLIEIIKASVNRTKIKNTKPANTDGENDNTNPQNRIKG